MPDNNRTVKTDGGLNFNITQPPPENAQEPLSEPEVVYVEPIETPLLQRVEPTASFAVDILSNKKVYPSITSRCLVHFRPSGKWKKDDPEYNYGFDWLRIGDTGDWSDKKEVDDHYASLIGRYYEAGTNNVCNDGNDWRSMRPVNGVRNPCGFRHEPQLYKSNLRSSFPRAFYVPSKSRNKSICSNNVPTDVKILIDKSQLYYTVPILFLRAMGEAKIKVKVELLFPKEKSATPKRIEFREHTNGNGAFTITPNSMPPKTKWQDITITSTREINRFELIDAVAVYDDPARPGTEKEEFCGQLRIHPNHHIRTVNILYVTPDIYKGVDLAGDGEDFVKDTEKRFIRKVIEGQLLANANIEYYPKFDVMGAYSWTDSGNAVNENIDNYTNATGTTVTRTMTDILTEALRSDLAAVAATATAGSRESDPDRFANYFVVFLVNLDSQVAPSTNMATRKATIYKKTVSANEGEVASDRQKETVMHEILHTFGLWHTFNARGNDPTYRARETENIMDYSHVDENRTKLSGLDRYSLWYWQIKKIWTVLDNQVRARVTQLNEERRIAGQPPIPIGIPNEDSNQMPATNNGSDVTQYFAKPRI